MSNLITASVSIAGTRALLWHAFTPDVIPASGRRERTGVRGNDPEEWRSSVLMTNERQLYLPASYVFGCLRDGAKFTRKGRGSIQTALVATLEVLDERVLVDRFVPPEPLPTDPNAPVFLHISSTRNPNTKARNIRYRVAAAAGWQAAFALRWDRTVVSRQELEAVLIDAGRLAGIGDARAIGLGRFQVRELVLLEG
jgi:hypothetical protein